MPPSDRFTPRRALAYGSLALAVLGGLVLAYDVLTLSRHGIAWGLVVAGAVGLVAAALWQAVSGETAAPDVTDAPGEAPSGGHDDRARARVPWIVAGVAFVVVAQALIPLRYYLGEDEYDERFSWRMFSAVRMQECNLAASETTDGAQHPVRLVATIHVGWITTLRRNREAVMERYLEWRCEQRGVERARLENQCRTPDGREVPLIVRELDCESGELTAEGGLP